MQANGSDWIKELESGCLKGQVFLNEPLRRYTSLKVGGPARALVFPADIEDLCRVLELSRRAKAPVFILGAGSNLLVRDGGYKGFVINLCMSFNQIVCQGNIVSVQAGVLVPRLMEYLAGHSLGGLEFLVGVPGTVGGAVATNAGAYGDEIGRYVKSATVLYLDGNCVPLKKEEITFGYRTSSLGGDCIVLNVELELEPRDRERIAEKAGRNLLKRRKAQPSGFSAGSVFKNPPGEYAGRLIEEVGLKGRRVGDAQVAENHANFIINRGKATAHDVEELIHLVQREVLVKKGIWLEPEIKIIGYAEGGGGHP